MAKNNFKLRKQQQQQKHNHFQQKVQQKHPKHPEQKKDPKHNKVTKNTIRAFPVEKLKRTWKVARPVGPGLVNVGNTCFLNSVLQCLTYTPAFTQYLLTCQHTSKCSAVGFCALCAMENHVKSCLCSTKSFKKNAATLPRPFTSNLNKISKLLRVGRQEDAHEFLTFLLQAFQKSIIKDMKATPQLEESTSISQIFGGKTRSQVTCYNCKAKTNNYQPFFDLSLDLTKAQTVQQALKNFTEIDIIGTDPQNRYNCEKCKQKVKVDKQMTVSRLPPTLTLHLQRFAYNPHSGQMSKINKPFRFPEMLDMDPYISNDDEKSARQETKYDLHAVLVHEGRTCDSGHYYAYVKSPDGRWNLMNDQFVSPVSRKEVFEERAYMLFYRQREGEPKEEEKKKKEVETMKIDERENALVVKKKKEEEEAEEKMLMMKEQAEEERLKSVLKRKREEAEEEEKKKKKKRVHIEDLPCSDDPSAWYVQRASEPHRSLRGVLSPPTYGAALSDESAWVQRDLGRAVDDSKKRRYRRKKLAGKKSKFNVKTLA